MEVLVMSNIFKKSIVGVLKKGWKWSPYQGLQGLVIDPESDIEGYCVAVFFNLEVSSSKFCPLDKGVVPIKEWDEEHGDQCRMGEVDFLFIDDAWKKCPRIVFFRPEELVVQDVWEIGSFARRVFRKEIVRSVYIFPDYLPKEPNLHMCHIRECAAQATKTALFNFQCSVYPIHVCDSCFPKTNGMFGNALPRCKVPLLSFDGKPMVRH